LDGKRIDPGIRARKNASKKSRRSLRTGKYEKWRKTRDTAIDG